MIELAFTVCLFMSPEKCEKRSLLFTEISPMACMMSAQGELAKWAREHPDWRIERYQCNFVNTTEHEA